MRKQLKKQLLDMLSTLEQAEHLLKQMEENTQESQRRMMMGDMQESAMALGNAVERSEGQGTKAVSVLESYCELLRQCVIETSLAQRQDIIKRMAAVRKQVYDYIYREIPVQYEIVFLPYKASMWDSLESIWMAAREDSDCHCHVIPIPYFDKRSDGTIGEIHYEGDQYPSYVPITDYRAYNLNEMKPDAVFIHNPYDEYNLVTSVHPAFYSKELLKCTNNLVYIPYYILSDSVPDHFCLLPGVVNSSYTIVQSELIRRDYLKSIRTAAGLTEAQFLGSAFQDRIIALGSPKIDRVLQGGMEGEVLPFGWREILYANR